MKFPAYLGTARVISGEVFWEPDYFDKPLSGSRFFRRNTLAASLAIAIATFLVIYYRSTFPIAIKGLLGAVVLNLVITWTRSLLAHRRMRALLALAHSEDIQRETFKLAITEAHAGPWSTFSSAFFLFLSIFLIMSHYEKHQWQNRLKGWLTVEASAPIPPEARPNPQEGQAPSPIHMDQQAMAAKLKRHVQPVYPKEAKIKGVEGTIRLHTIVAKDGSVGKAEVISGPKELEQAALDAVRQWQYEPTIWKGQAVEVDTTIFLVFKLHK